MKEENNFNYQNSKNILNIVYKQISSFDTKAGILISIIAILTGLSFNFINVLSLIKNQSGSFSNEVSFEYIVFSITFLLSIITSFICILFSILVIVPRKHHEKRININYYNDLKDMSYEDYENNGKIFISSDEQIFKQIKINSNICAKKHFYLKASIITLIPYSVLLITLIILAIIFVF